MSPRTASLAVTKTGLRIGIAHQQRPMPALGADAERLQAALLDARTSRPRPWFMRALAAAWRWC